VAGPARRLDFADAPCVRLLPTITALVSVALPVFG